jgi:hypothetical protein
LSDTDLIAPSSSKVQTSSADENGPALSLWQQAITTVLTSVVLVVAGSANGCCTTTHVPSSTSLPPKTWSAIAYSPPGTYAVPEKGKTHDVLPDGASSVQPPQSPSVAWLGTGGKSSQGFTQTPAGTWLTLRRPTSTLVSVSK